MLTNTDITLVISHPDDEVMFFGPTLGLLTIPDLNNTVSIVSFSSGNAQGLGELRKKELILSALNYKIPPNRVHIIDEESKFPDSMTVHWDQTEIAAVLDKILTAEQAVITFDEQGVSGHTNHISVSKGVAKWAEEHQQSQVWNLRSVPLARKYLMLFDAFISYYVEPGLIALHKHLYGRLEEMGYEWYLPEPVDRPRQITIVSRQEQYSQAKTIMVEAHKSQMQWYRHGWILFSRYMIVNDLVKVQ